MKKIMVVVLSALFVLPAVLAFGGNRVIAKVRQSFTTNYGYTNNFNKAVYVESAGIVVSVGGPASSTATITVNLNDQAYDIATVTTNALSSLLWVSDGGKLVLDRGESISFTMTATNGAEAFMNLVGD